MPTYRFSRKAAADLGAIARYTEQHWGRAQRLHYLHLIEAGCETIAATPLIGRDCSLIRPGYRKYQIEKHLIFYYLTLHDEIEIIRILHQRMDVEPLLTE